MSLSVTEQQLYAAHEAFRWSKWLQWTASPILLTIGSAGNCMSAWILWGGSSSSSTQLYLLLLAAADQLTLLTGLLKVWISSLVGFDVGRSSRLLCVGSNFVSTLATHLSVSLIAAVTLNRALLLRRPASGPAAASFDGDSATRAAAAVARTRCVIACIAIACLLLNLHWLFVLDVYTFNWNDLSDNSTFVLCDIRQELMDQLKTPLAWYDFALYSLLPTSVILMCNAFIIWKLQTSQRRYANQQCGHQQQQQQKQLRPSRSFSRSVGQVSIMLLTVSFFFVAASLPITVLKVVSSLSSIIDDELNNDTEFYSGYKLALVLAELLMYANHSLNFCLYSLTDRRFRRQLKRQMRRLCCCAGDDRFD